jgi:hypothetical protein
MRWLGSYPRKIKEDEHVDSCKKCGQIYLVERSNVIDWQIYQHELVWRKYHDPPGTDIAVLQ